MNWLAIVLIFWFGGAVGFAKNYFESLRLGGFFKPEIQDKFDTKLRLVWWLLFIQRSLLWFVPDDL